MSHKAIHAALDARMASMPGLPHVAWPNRGYAPVDGVLYIRPTFLPASTVEKEIGAGATERVVGLYQVDIFGQPGVGKDEAETVAEEIKAHFPKGLSPTYDGVAVGVGKTSIGPGRTDNGRYIISVTVEWRADVTP